MRFPNVAQYVKNLSGFFILLLMSNSVPPLHWNYAAEIGKFGNLLYLGGSSDKEGDIGSTDSHWHNLVNVDGQTSSFCAIGFGKVENVSVWLQTSRQMPSA